MAEWSFFDDRTLRTFRAAAVCVVPPEPDSPGADADAALRIVDRALAARPERDRRLLTAFLRFVEVLPLLRYGRRFSSLDPARRALVLRFLETTRLSKKLRQGFFGVKTFALLGYYGMESTFHELGYPGPRLDAPYYARARREV